MKSVLLIGLGRFGQHIARKLHELNIEVMAVDDNEARVQAALPYVTRAQIGNATDELFLQSLGVRNYDACIVAIGESFQDSMVTVSMIKELGAKKVVARASRDVQQKLLLRNGADEVVYPEKQLATWTAIRCASAHVLDYFELDDTLSMMELAVPDAWNGKTVGGLDIRRKYGISILGIRENGTIRMNISPETPLYRGQSVLVLGEPKFINRVTRL